MQGTRAQVFTLEAVLAAIIVLTGLVFALQAVAVTPSTAGMTTQPVEPDMLDSVLTGTAENGALKRAVLAWDGGQFVGPSSGAGYYVDAYPGNDFGAALKQALGPTIAVNVRIHYQTAGGGTDSVRMIYSGAPAEGAVRAATTVAAFDSDVLYDASGNPRAGTSISADGLYPDIEDQPGDLYSVLEVEVVAWRA